MHAKIFRHFTIKSSVDLRGYGTCLSVTFINNRAAALGKHVVVGGIDAENIGSLSFHERLGFERVAHFREVGFKFGRFLDLILVQLTIR